MVANEQDLLKRLGVNIDAGTLRLALTHRSYAYENGGLPTNERLEFLGDSILGYAVTDSLFRDHPDLPEGDLAKRRAAVVSTRALAGIARELKLGDYVLLGQGEKLTNGKNKSSILADTMEAIFGATYLSCGIEVARQLVMRLTGPLLGDDAALGAGTDWKTSVQETAATENLGTVEYIVEGFGPDHARTYEAKLLIGSIEYGTGKGPSKKEAEKDAAAEAWKKLSASGIPAPETPNSAQGPFAGPDSGQVTSGSSEYAQESGA